MKNTSPISTSDKKVLYHSQNLFEHFLFWSRWLQAPFYFGLIVAQCVYVYKFFAELWHLVVSSPTMNDNMVMLSVLALIDVVMIANLLIMVTIGGYQTFVSKLDFLSEERDQPEWLSHVNAGVLKIKLATAIIGISSIHLLKTFINAENMKPETMLWQTVLHMTFVFSALLLAYTDKVMNESIQSMKH